MRDPLVALGTAFADGVGGAASGALVSCRSKRPDCRRWFVAVPLQPFSAAEPRNECGHDGDDGDHCAAAMWRLCERSHERILGSKRGAASNGVFGSSRFTMGGDAACPRQGGCPRRALVGRIRE